MEAKKCSGPCKLEKPLDEFAKNSAKKDGRSHCCKVCQRQYVNRHYQENKDYYKQKARKGDDNRKLWHLELKSNLKCEECGLDHPAVLDFHHENPEDKEMSVSKAIGIGWGRARVLKEISKCKVLCSNCHRILHWKQRQQTMGV